MNANKEVMTMKITALDEMKLVGLRVVCPGDQYIYEIPKASYMLKNRLDEIKHKVVPAHMVGAYVVGDYTDEEDGYWACVEVSDFEDIPAGMVTISIPQQRYAVKEHYGSNHLIWKTYEELHKWIAENGYERNLRAWHIEISEKWGEETGNEVKVVLYDTIN